MGKGVDKGAVPPDDPLFTGGPRLHTPMPASELSKTGSEPAPEALPRTGSGTPMLEEMVKRAEAKYGPDNPLAKDLRRQLEGSRAAGSQSTARLFMGRPMATRKDK